MFYWILIELLDLLNQWNENIHILDLVRLNVKNLLNALNVCFNGEIIINYIHIVIKIHVRFYQWQHSIFFVSLTYLNHSIEILNLKMSDAYRGNFWKQRLIIRKISHKNCYILISRWKHRWTNSRPADPDRKRSNFECFSHKALSNLNETFTFVDLSTNTDCQRTTPC